VDDKRSRHWIISRLGWILCLTRLVDMLDFCEGIGFLFRIDDQQCAGTEPSQAGQVRKRLERPSPNRKRTRTRSGDSLCECGHEAGGTNQRGNATDARGSSSKEDGPLGLAVLQEESLTQPKTLEKVEADWQIRMTI
jgi:hypothetical protein